MRCQACGTAKHTKLYDDPSDPPIDTKPCMCADCAIGAHEDIADENERLARDHLEEAEKIRREDSDTKKKEKRK